MYNLLKYSNDYSKTSRSLWQYYRDELALSNDDTFANVPGNSASFRFNQKITGSTGVDGTTNVEIMALLKYLSNIWRNLEMQLISYEINHILTCSANFVISNATANQDTTFAITDTKLYVPVVILSAEDNAKLLQLLKSGFKHTINWNKYHEK